MAQRLARMASSGSMYFGFWLVPHGLAFFFHGSRRFCTFLYTDEAFLDIS